MARSRPFTLGVPLLVTTLAAASVSWEWIRTRGALADMLGPLCLLLAAAVLAELLVRRFPASAPPGLSRGFVLAALALLPSPGGILVGFAVLICGRPMRHPASPAAEAVTRFSVLLALWLTQALAAAASPFFPPGTAGSLLLLAVVHVHLEGIALATGWIVARISGALPLFDSDHPVRRIAAEAVNVPVAWILLALGAEGQSPAARPLFVGLVLLGALALRLLATARRDLQATNDALAARVTELATLHSIGREIASSLELRRVYSTVERECRKILDVDRFAIALVDPDTRDLKSVYRHMRGEAPSEQGAALADGLQTWVVAERQGVRIDDTDGMRAAGVEASAEGPYGSALAVPLIVEDRVVGVLEVHSRRERAYDEHLLSVLTTVAQQAAVAIENARHHRMATVDSLTGLFLREYFFRRAEEEHKRAGRYRGVFSVLMIDLDRLKSLNDRFGHLAADRYLQALGEVIRTRLRAADLACRFGGDEFCLLLPETDAQGAAIMAERLRGAIARMALSGDNESGILRTTASIGVAVFPDDDTGELSGLMRRADQALYSAKRRGRNRVVAFRDARSPGRTGPTAAAGS